MPVYIPVLLFAGFSLWLLFREAKRSNHSGPLWIPVVWACIIASKPISLWFGTAGDVVGPYQDSFLDKALLTFLISSGVLVLVRRRIKLRQVIAGNKWLFLFFA